jgi:hypothetical protein
LAARVVHGGGPEDVEEELDMAVDESDTVITDDDYRDYQETARPYRPGRGGYDPEAAAEAARAKYSFRQRMVLLLLVLAVLSGLFAGLVMPIVWWGHGGVDLLLVGYLGYLRRQVRIEADIRERRQARLRGRAADDTDFVEAEYDHPEYDQPDYDQADYDQADYGRAGYDEAPAAIAEPAEPEPAQPELSEYEDAPRSTPARAPYRPRPTLTGTVVVDIDDEDPAFEDLDLPLRRGYRRAAG